jgi:hypothetical protein
MGQQPKRIVVIDDHAHFMTLMATRIRKATSSLGPGFDVFPGLLDWTESEELEANGSRSSGVHIISMTHTTALKRAVWTGLYCAFVDVRDDLRSWHDAAQRDDTPERYFAGIDVVRHIHALMISSRLIVYSSELHNPYLWLPLHESTCEIVKAYYHVDSFDSEATVLSALRDEKPIGAVDPPTKVDYARLGLGIAPIAQTLDDLRSSNHWSVFAGANAYKDLPGAARRWFDRRAAGDGFQLRGGSKLFALLRRMTSPEVFERKRVEDQR